MEEDCIVSSVTTQEQESNDVGRTTPYSSTTVDALSTSSEINLFKKPVFGGPSSLVIKKKVSLTSSAAFSSPEDSSKTKRESPNSLNDDSDELNTGETKNEEGNDAKPEKKNERKKKPKNIQKIHVPSVVENSAVSNLGAGLDYTEPEWGGASDELYYFEAVKNGTVVDKYDLSCKSFHVFGRLPSCDHSMDHPSLSRHHVVIQHCDKMTPTRAIGWYLYDLDSTHGTWINKNRVTPRIYCRLRVGYVVKFGGSSRLYILQGPADDQDTESELSVAEMRAQRERQKNEAEVLRRVDEMEAEEMTRLKVASKEKSEGCSWGIDDDDDGISAEDSDAPNPFALPDNETLYIDDPKKALRGFFEREGFELPEYMFTDEGKGKFRCRVELPVDTPTGEPLVAEVTNVGKKKDIVIECALEACRMLDRQGLLRKATHESRAKKRKNWEETNYYDSDEDSYWDRTGDVEEKRQKRIMRVMKTESKAETYESLSAKLEEAKREKEDIEVRLEKDKAVRADAEDEALDALDAFMISIKTGETLDTKTRTQLKHRLVLLRQQVLQLEKLVNIARPATESLPKLGIKPAGAPVVPTVGKMKCPAKPVRQAVTVSSTMPAARIPECDDIEEEEEDDDDDDVCRHSTSVGADLQRNDKDIETISAMSSDNTIVNLTKDKSLITTTKEIPSTAHNIDKNSEVFRSKPKFNNCSAGVDNCADSVQSAAAQELGKNKNEIVKKINGGMRKEIKAAVIAADPSTVVDPDYAVWLPPNNQSGDGKTELNKRFGY